MADDAKKPLKATDLALYAVAMTLSVRWIATAAAAGPAALVMWVAAMIGFMAPLVIATAELAGRFDDDGGLYVWTRETLGPFWGFMCGWLYWTCNISYFSGLLVFIVNILAMAAPSPVGEILKNPQLFLIVALVISVMVAAMHLLGLGAGKWLSNFGAAAGFALLGVLVVAGATLSLKHGPATDLIHADYLPKPTADIAILWGTMVFAFGGPEALAFLRNDVQGGIRKILQVLAIVALLLTLAYLAGTTAILSILSPGETGRLSGLPDAVNLSLGRLGVGYAAPFVLGLVGISMLGGYSSWFGVAARLPFAAGVDDVLPKAFGKKDPKTGAPVASILVQSAAVIALVLLSQSGGSGLKAAYDFLVAMSVLSYTLPFVFLFIVYIVAQKAPAPAHAWVPPGGRKTSLTIGWVGLVVALSAILCTLVPSPDELDKAGSVLKLVAASLVLAGAGAVFYGAAKRRKHRS